MLPARLVLASGYIITVSVTENVDLWWGLRGAGHNFVIVSELTVKTYPQVNDGMHWTGMLAYPGTEPVLEKILNALEEIHMGAGMACTMILPHVLPAGWQLLNLQVKYTLYLRFSLSSVYSRSLLKCLAI
jgi:hypothetical protein